MVRYDYKCLKCENEFEYTSKKMESESERFPICPTCGNEDKKKLEFFHPIIPFQLKGSGWFKSSAIDHVDPTSISGVKRIKKTKKSQGVLHKVKR